VTMQPMTVQGDLCVPSPLTYGGGFRATGAPKTELQLSQCRPGLLPAIDCERPAGRGIRPICACPNLVFGHELRCEGKN
jgi:hypothetical protein